ncbi:hypothetical protein CMV_008590 [Castanea mollissima]|uniref:Uncharacterized protein n=1 Tax=Castanea mollissima TaxID=60419 RepID=A0A8J4VZE7_9ROSI|nr:hypothetical protein CMV_008590 [Castanea mollissima]
MFRLTQKIKVVRVALLQWGGSNARGLIQSVSEKMNLLTSLELECHLASEPCYKRALNKLLDGEKVKFLFAAASTARAQSSVIKIVSTISPDDAAGPFEECMGLVTNCSGISDNVEKQAEVRSAHKFFQSCDGFDDMFEALTVRLQKTAYRCHKKFGTEIPKNSFSSTKRKKSMSSGKISDKWKCVGGKKAFDFEKDYSIAVGIAWQIRDLLISEDSRKAILGSQTLEMSFIALKIISDSLNISSQKDCGTRNNSTDSSRSLPELTVLDQTMDHMLNCTEKLLGAGDSGKYRKLPSELGQAYSKTGSSHRQGNKKPQTDASSPSAHDSPNIEQKRVLIKVKMLTASLKFMVDATMMAFDVANNLLDLITSIELHLGSGKAASLVAAAKPWLPDLILALGSGNILKETQGEGIHFHASDRIKVHFPSWLLSLARIELSEMSEFSPEKDDDDRVSESEDFPVFKKLLGMIVTLLKGNPNVLDAVGVIFLTGSVVGLERKDFGLVLGLIHFVCMKLFSRDDKEWGDMMLASLQEIYPQIERELYEENDEDGRQKLHSAQELLEPVWMYHIYETGRVATMEG